MEPSTFNSRSEEYLTGELTPLTLPIKRIAGNCDYVSILQKHALAIGRIETGSAEFRFEASARIPNYKRVFACRFE